MKFEEVYISVDVETSGPIPGDFSLLSIGACLVSNPDISIYLELRPMSQQYDLKAVAVTGLDLEKLTLEGLHPTDAMLSFEKWISTCCHGDQKPIFVGLNAPFDWSFINYYFHKFLGHNPFGYSALDIKAYFMGMNKCLWQETKYSYIAKHHKPSIKPNHHALVDARAQAELFALLLENNSSRKDDPI